MDYVTLTCDEEKLVPSSCYGSGRSSETIDRIILHHNAGKLSHTSVYNTFVNNGTSAHYNVDASGGVCRFVSDSDTAYHAGNITINRKSIGIEHSNTSSSSPWTIPDETLEAGAHLVAALCLYYSLGTPVYGSNVFFHSDVKATACPGEIAGDQMNEYFERATYWYEQMSGTTTSSSETTTSNSGTLDVDGWIGPKTVTRWQELLGTTADGYFSNQYQKYSSYLSRISSSAIKYYTSPSGSSKAVKAIQKIVGATQDGYWGPKTVKALQAYVGTTQDGYLGPNTAKAVQTKLNTGSF